MSLFPDFSSYRARTRKRKGSLEPLLQARSDGLKGNCSIPFLARPISDLVRILRKKSMSSGKTPNPSRIILFCFVTSLSNLQESARRHWNEENWPRGARDRPLRDSPEPSPEQVFEGPSLQRATPNNTSTVSLGTLPTYTRKIGGSRRS